jgi:fatty-acyl-CoA synthase
VLYGVPTMFN